MARITSIENLSMLGEVSRASAIAISTPVPFLSFLQPLQRLKTISKDSNPQKLIRFMIFWDVSLIEPVLGSSGMWYRSPHTCSCFTPCGLHPSLVLAGQQSAQNESNRADIVNAKSPSTSWSCIQIVQWRRSLYHCTFSRGPLWGLYRGSIGDMRKYGKTNWKGQKLPKNIKFHSGLVTFNVDFPKIPNVFISRCFLDYQELGGSTNCQWFFIQPDISNKIHLHWNRRKKCRCVKTKTNLRLLVE